MSEFTLDIDLPLPLNAGCYVDLYIPSPLFIGPELTDIKISGMFGSLRNADVTADADQNLIIINDACPQYM